MDERITVRDNINISYSHLYIYKCRLNLFGVHDRCLKSWMNIVLMHVLTVTKSESVFFVWQQPIWCYEHIRISRAMAEKTASFILQLHSRLLLLRIEHRSDKDSVIKLGLQQKTCIKGHRIWDFLPHRCISIRVRRMTDLLQYAIQSASYPGLRLSVKCAASLFIWTLN